MPDIYTFPFSLTQFGAVGDGITDDSAAIQAAIDAAAPTSSAIFVPPGAYVISSAAITVKKGVSLCGTNFACLKGPKPRNGAAATLAALPSGSSFIIKGAAALSGTGTFKLEGNNALTGLTSFYPEQAYAATTNLSTNLVQYAPTIKSAAGKVSGFVVKDCQFIGATAPIAFKGTNGTDDYVFDITIDGCYGYPLGVTPQPFIDLNYVLDIPRISRCHVNPGVGVLTIGQRADPASQVAVTPQIIDHCCFNALPSYRIGNTDEFSMWSDFVFGAKTGIEIFESYGTIDKCNVDMVQTGVLVNITSSYRDVLISNLSGVPSAGAAARNLIVANLGGQGGLIASGLRAHLGGNTVVPSSGGSALSMVEINGTGTAEVIIHKGIAHAGFTRAPVYKTNTNAAVQVIGTGWAIGTP